MDALRPHFTYSFDQLIDFVIKRKKESILRVFAIEKDEYATNLRNRQVYYLSDM